MTGPGDDVPRPWDGKPPPHYTDTPAGPAEEPPRQRPSRRSVAAIVVAVVVVAGAGLTLLFTGGSARGGGGRPVAVGTHLATTSRQPTTTTPPPTTTTTASPNPAAAYDVGSCFDEVGGATPGSVQLNLVPCGGSDSVFVINKVVTSAAQCDSGADYRDHGYEVPDQTANVAYCASLVVPANTCFVLGTSVPIARAACGSAPDVVRVLAIEPAPSAALACTDKTNPDIWFYQAPSSGQFACVSRPAATTTTTATAG